MRKHLTYANVTATVALFVALGGGAYAISRVGSNDIRNGSIRSVDLRDHRAVSAWDVRGNALGGAQIAEKTLNASRFAKIAGKQSLDCDPSSSSVYVDCAEATLRISHRARILVIATGQEESVGGAASANCEVRIDDAPAAIAFSPGESSILNTSPTATNGFARTLVSPDVVAAGPHKVALACAELNGNVKIDEPTIAAIAINGRWEPAVSGDSILTAFTAPDGRSVELRSATWNHVLPVVLLSNANWLLERDGKLVITIPERVESSREELAPALSTG